MTTPEAIDDTAALPPAPGALVAVDGVRVHVEQFGSGRHTLVFDAGMGAWSTAWCLVAPAIARDARVVLWDRPGLGWSDEDHQPRSIDRTIDLLRATLVAVDAPPPYVLVGHSMGGINMTRYARLHPEEVEGALLVDPTTTDMRNPSPLPAPLLALVAGGIQVAAAIASRLKPPRSDAAQPAEVANDPFAALPAEQVAIAKAIMSRPVYARTVAAEAGARLANIASERANERPWPAIPLAVLSSSGKDIEGLPSWGRIVGITRERVVNVLQQSHQRLAAEVPNGRWVAATESGHNIPFDQPEVVIDAARWVLAQLP